jgi:hypothetical protein
MSQKFLTFQSGSLTLIEATSSSAGSGDSGKIVALDGTGKIHESMMPNGIGPEISTIVCSENLSAGNLVNIYNNAGTENVRKADATTNGKEANGFVLSSYTSGASAVVYTEGKISGLTGLTPGPLFLHTTAGASTSTAPSTVGNVIQRIGVATSSTEIAFSPGPVILIG